MNDEQRYKQGIEVRTEVLGEKNMLVGLCRT